MEDLRKQEIHLEDGRKADKVIQEISDPVSCESKVVTELFVEPKIEKRLSRRVVETKKPVVIRREIEDVDEATGDVVSRKIETTDPEVRMELREHIQTNTMVSALNADECNCYVTQEDMQKAFTEGFVAVAEVLKGHNGNGKSGKVSMQEVVADKIENTGQTLTLTGTIMWATIAALSAAFVYVVFVM